MDQDNVNLLGAITSDDYKAMMNALLPALEDTNSASVTLREGLFRIKEEVDRGQRSLTPGMKERIRELLRKWRCESPLFGAYGGDFNSVVPFLRKLTIFKTLEVPLFIDNYGDKEMISHYQGLALENNEPTETIPITLETPIVHVTHTLQKENIVDNARLMPSNNKNIIEGLWFSPRYQLGDPPKSVYGNWAFETTLGRLGVRSLRQGEVVAYKNEVNFIVYASDTVPPQSPVFKATENAVQSRHGPDAYAAVSIFVPSRFLPEPGDALAGFGEPYQVLHAPFCVPERRRVLQACVDVSESLFAHCLL